MNQKKESIMKKVIQFLEETNKKTDELQKTFTKTMGNASGALNNLYVNSDTIDMYRRELWRIRHE